MYQPASPPLDEIFQRLRIHDSEWLQQTLSERWTTLSQDKSRQNVICQQAPLWQYDTTLLLLPEGLVVSEYIHFIRSYDWGSTMLGAMSTWSLDMRRAVNQCLCDKQPASLWIGPEHIGFYNKAYLCLAGAKHPRGLGRPFLDMWPDEGHAFVDFLDQVQEHGSSFAWDELPLIVVNAGEREEIVVSFSLAPIIASDGGIFGIYTRAQEGTAKAILRRRMSVLLNVVQQTSQAQGRKEFWRHLVRSLGPALVDIPFTAVYTFTQHDQSTNVSSASTSSHEEWHWTLAGTSGLPPASKGMPSELDAAQAEKLFTDRFASALETRQPLILTTSDGTFPSVLQNVIKLQSHGDPCSSAVIIPICPANDDDIHGFILLGLNPLHKYDDQYELFIELFGKVCATSLASVVLLEEEIRRAANAAQLASQDRIKLRVELAETQQQVVHSANRFQTLAELAPMAMFQLDSQGDIVFANQHWIDITGHQRKDWGVKSWIHAVYPGDKAVTDAEWSKLLAGESVTFEMRWAQDVADREEIYISGERVEGPTWTVASAYPEIHADGSVHGVIGCLIDISRHKWVEGFQERRMLEALEMKRQQESFMDMISHEARNPLSVMLLCTESILYTLQDISKAEPSTFNDIATAGLDVQGTINQLTESTKTVMSCIQHQGRIIDDVLTLSKLNSSLLSINTVPMQPRELAAHAMKMFEIEANKYGIKMTLTIHHSYQDLRVDWMRMDPNRLLQILINLLTNALKFTQAEPTKHITITLYANATRPSRSARGVDFEPEQPEIAGNTYITFEVTDSGRGMTSEQTAELFVKFRQSTSPKTYVSYGSSGLGLFICRQLSQILGGAIGLTSSKSGTTFAFYVAAPCCTAPELEGGSSAPGSKFETNSIFTESARLTDASEYFDNTNQPWTAPTSPAQQKATPPAQYNAITVASSTVAAAGDQHKEVKPEMHNSVLIVEDNLVNQTVLRAQLEKLKYNVSVANHGLEALEFINNSRMCISDGNALDFVLMDVEMPVCDGLECTRRIRQLQTDGQIKTHIPIIGVTANARAEQQNMAIAAGMDEVLTKPFRVMQLADRLAGARQKFYG